MDLQKLTNRGVKGLIFVSAILLAFTACAYTALPGVEAPQERQTRYSIYDRLVQYGPSSRGRWRPQFSLAGLSYPPLRVILVAFKAEKILHVYAGDEEMRWLSAFEICAASGSIGPKLREGDMQVPEGIYSIPYLVPNSRFHLSLRVNYPNAFDRLIARLDGRTNLGGDIMIHGKCVSRGCLAMGDRAIEDLFVLVADTGVKNVQLIIAPHDLRNLRVQAEFHKSLSPWTAILYSLVEAKLRQLPEPFELSSIPARGARP